MSQSLAAAGRLQAALDQLGRGLNLPQTSACGLMYDRFSIPAGSSDVPPNPKELETIRTELFEWCKRNGAYTVPAPLLKKAPLVFWSGDRHAAGIEGLPETFLAAVDAGRESWLILLIEAWLRDFNPKLDGFSDFGYKISSRIRSAKHPRLIGWSRADQQLKIFNAEEGPKRLGDALLHPSKSVEAVLAEAGMNDPLRAHGQFFQATVMCMLDRLPAALGSPSAPRYWDHASSILEVVNHSRDRFGRLTAQRGLRFEESRVKTAQRCTDAWLQGQVHASAPRAAVLSFLVATIGDPRLQPLKWDGVPEDNKRLMRSWLSAETLEAFLSLISNTGDTHQWRYRQSFWRSCLRKVPGAEVWVVLGRDLARQAKVANDLRGSFGTMNKADQAVLLMRLGDIVFSEWSNVGSLRAWDINDPRCPALHRQTTYEVNSLVAPCLEFPENGSSVVPRGFGNGKGLVHHNPVGGGWQGRAAALLRAKTGINLVPQDYM